jgi:hypothetical protein
MKISNVGPRTGDPIRMNKKEAPQMADRRKSLRVLAVVITVMVCVVTATVKANLARNQSDSCELLSALARSAAIYKSERFSDLAPITAGDDFAL